MNYLGVYHSSFPRSTSGICDAPCVSKGRMMICAHEVASDEYWLAMTYGRIRNRLELLNELGCEADLNNAQLVLSAYRRWGVRYAEHIRGPVMTCIMDTANDYMVLTRDVMGEQPIFYAPGRDGRIVFSDHPDSLLKSACAEPVVDRQGLCEIFGMGPSRTPGRTPLRDVYTLEPGCALIGCDGKAKIWRYYVIPDRPHLENEEETVAHTRELLDKIMDQTALLRPGAMLSGGLDSTALTAMLCARNTGILTFSVDYRDNEADFRPNSFRPSMDSPYILKAVDTFSTRHHSTVLESASLAEKLEEAVSARGFPGMADIDTSLMLFAREIAGKSHRVVSGECGDEVFGGYPWFVLKEGVQHSCFPWSGSLKLRESILRCEIRRKLRLNEYVRNLWAMEMEASEINAATDEHDRKLKQMQRICFRTFMANLQERAVRMCGHYGVEVLTPLCDERLVEYVYNVPWKMKFMGGIEKGLFRAAVADLLPEDLLKRKKSPYPKTCSPIYTEIVRGLTMAMLTDKGAPIFEWVDRERLSDLAASDLDPAATPWYGQLMAGPQMLAYIWQVNRWLEDRNIWVNLN